MNGNFLHLIVLSSVPPANRNKMSQKLWVEYRTAGRSFITKVSTDGCEHLDDFLKEIKKEFSFTLASYHTCQLALYQADGTSEIKHTDTFKSLQDAGNCGAMPLIVMAIRRYFEKCGLGEIRTFSPSSRQTSLIDISKKQKTE